MKKRAAILLLGLTCTTILVGVGWLQSHSHDPISHDTDRVILLVPDDTDFSNPSVTVWLDAANEEGLHLVPMHDASFLRPLSIRQPYAGVILPDSVHQQASDLLLSAIRGYVSAGGKLMLVYDAGLKSQQGFYENDRSRLSDLAGINYALYGPLREATILSGDVGGKIPVMDALGVPPGKYYPLSPPPGQDPASGHDDFEVQLRRYKYGDVEYPSFVTSGTYSGQVLLRSRAGIVAGYHPYQKGAVLFVNLPLGFLDEDTDGLPLHGFLKYFAMRILSMPFLMSVPDGVGGLVLDWHIDSNASLKALQVMENWTILKQGPYSMDITAGPDTYALGDNQGFNVLNNPVSQGFVREYQQLGNEIGSHGGWIHNYFGEHVDKDPPAEMEKYLQLNNDAVEQVTGKPVLEYSAPIGNQPQWVTHWLEAHNFVGYYFTGDTGMGPTLGYRNGQRAGETIWAFPILHLDRAASFEEMTTEGYSEDIAKQWLDGVTDFLVNHRQVRLIYFHPPGLLGYEQVISDWMEKTAQLKADGTFRWYTMVQIGNFLNSRKQVQWSLTENNGFASLEAADPQTLVHQTWWLPTGRFARPNIVEGTATVQQGSDGWIVVAGEGAHLKMEARLINP